MLRYLVALIYFFIPVDSACAADLEVKVFSGGEPAKDVQVCIGTAQQRALYSNTVTDEEGVTSISGLPEGRVMVTANQGSRGRDKMVNNTAYSQSVMIALPDEIEGPKCPERE